MAKILIQILTAIAVSIGHIATGYMTVWPSYTIPIFQSHDTPLTGALTTTHEALLGSMPMLGSLLGTLFGAGLADAIGRKRGMLLCALFYTVGWAIISTTRDVNILIASRMTLGVSGGLFSGIFTLFIGEISAASMRGSLMSIASFGYVSGMLMSYVMGWLFSYYVGNYMIFSVTVLFTLAMMALKETPMYLLKNGREKEAIVSLKFYRQASEATKEILDELSEIKSLLQTPQKPISPVSETEPEKEKLQQEDLELPSPEVKSKYALKLLFSSPSSLRALCIICLLIALVTSSGMICILTYAGPLFIKAVPSLSPNMCSVVLAVASIVGGSITVFLSDIAGRRILMVSSCILMTLCLATLGVLLTWPIAPDWTIIVLVLLYCFAYQFGAGSVPYVLNSECYLPEVKSLGILLGFCTMWICNFVSLAIFQPFINIFGLNGTFFMYAIITGATAVISFIIVPETSGLGTAEIQTLFKGSIVQVGRTKKYIKTKTIEE